MFLFYVASYFFCTSLKRKHTFSRNYYQQQTDSNLLSPELRYYINILIYTIILYFINSLSWDSFSERIPHLFSCVIFFKYSHRDAKHVLFLPSYLPRFLWYKVSLMLGLLKLCMGLRVTWSFDPLCQNHSTVYVVLETKHRALCALQKYFLWTELYSNPIFTIETRCQDTLPICCSWSFWLTWHKLHSSGKKDYPHQTGLWARLWGIFLSNVWCQGPSSLWVLPPLGL